MTSFGGGWDVTKDRPGFDGFQNAVADGLAKAKAAGDAERLAFESFVRHLLNNINEAFVRHLALL